MGRWWWLVACTVRTPGAPPAALRGRPLGAKRASVHRSAGAEQDRKLSQMSAKGSALPFDSGAYDMSLLNVRKGGTD